MVDHRRYRAAEAALFASVGLVASERFVRLPRLGVGVRVLEVGDGKPAVFLQGGPNAVATFAQLVAAVSGVRCLLVERPGTGLSDPPPFVPDAHTLPGYVETLVADVLDALELGTAAIAASSFGGYCALRGALALPGRVSRLVLLGSPAFVPGWAAPRFFTLLRTPVIGAMLVAAPPTDGMVRFSLRQMGHGASVAAGTIDRPMIDWIAAWQRDTATTSNDVAMIRACGTRRHGFAARLDLTDDELAAIAAPTLALIGTDDPVGSAAVGEHLVAAMPRATLELLPGAGHLPWLDDPGLTAGRMSGFVGDASVAI